MFSRKIIICVEVYNFRMESSSSPQILIKGVVLLDNEDNYYTAVKIIRNANEIFNGGDDEWRRFWEDLCKQLGELVKKT